MSEYVGRYDEVMKELVKFDNIASANNNIFFYANDPRFEEYTYP